MAFKSFPLLALTCNLKVAERIILQVREHSDTGNNNNNNTDISTLQVWNQLHCGPTNKTILYSNRLAIFFAKDPQVPFVLFRLSLFKYAELDDDRMTFISNMDCNMSYDWAVWIFSAVQDSLTVVFEDYLKDIARSVVTNAVNWPGPYLVIPWTLYCKVTDVTSFIVHHYWLGVTDFPI